MYSVLGILTKTQICDIMSVLIVETGNFNVLSDNELCHVLLEALGFACIYIYIYIYIYIFSLGMGR